MQEYPPRPPAQVRSGTSDQQAAAVPPPGSIAEGGATPAGCRNIRTCLVPVHGRVMVRGGGRGQWRGVGGLLVEGSRRIGEAQQAGGGGRCRGSGAVHRSVGGRLATSGRSLRGRGAAQRPGRGGCPESEPPRVLWRLPIHGRVGRWEQHGSIRTSCVTGRSGWCWTWSRIRRSA